MGGPSSQFTREEAGAVAALDSMATTSTATTPVSALAFPLLPTTAQNSSGTGAGLGWAGLSAGMDMWLLMNIMENNHLRRRQRMYEERGRGSTHAKVQGI